MNEQLIYFIAAIIVIYLFGRILMKPLKKILKILINSILGGIVLYIINTVGAVFEFHIGVNALTLITIGLLQIPGLLCLIGIKFLV